MSAYVVNKSHINAMIQAGLLNRYGTTWFYNGEHHKLDERNANEVGQMLTLEALKAKETQEENETARRLVVRDKLYYGFRYRRDSYKARKAMIHPFLIVAKRGLSTLRLYDDGSHQPTKHQEQAMTDKCRGWRQKERELKKIEMPAYKKWLKDNHLTAKNNPYSCWVVNIRDKEVEQGNRHNG